MRITALIPAKKKSVRLKIKILCCTKEFQLLNILLMRQKNKTFSEIAVSTDNKKIQNRLKLKCKISS